MALTPESVNELATAVLECVCQALDATASAVAGQPGCPCRACVVPGPPPWDSCGDPCDAAGVTGGQLSVHVSRIYPTTDFPTETREVLGLKSCSPTRIAVELVVTLLRCVPISDDQSGCPPTCEETAAAARVIQIDSATVLTALMCCVPSIGPRHRGPLYVIGQQKTLEPRGDCGGIEQRVTIALPSCACPEEESP